MPCRWSRWRRWPHRIPAGRQARPRQHLHGSAACPALGSPALSLTVLDQPRQIVHDLLLDALGLRGSLLLANPPFHRPHGLTDALPQVLRITRLTQVISGRGGGWRALRRHLDAGGATLGSGRSRRIRCFCAREPRAAIARASNRAGRTKGWLRTTSPPRIQECPPFPGPCPVLRRTVLARRAFQAAIARRRTRRQGSG